MNQSLIVLRRVDVFDGGALFCWQDRHLLLILLYQFLRAPRQGECEQLIKNGTIEDCGMPPSGSEARQDDGSPGFEEQVHQGSYEFDGYEGMIDGPKKTGPTGG